MVSPAKYFQKHTFSDIFPAFCTHFTASVAPLLIFPITIMTEKGNLLAKVCMKRQKCFLKLVQTS